MKMQLAGILILLAAGCGGSGHPGTVGETPVQNPVYSIDVEPDVVNLQRGQSFQLEAKAKDQTGSTLGDRVIVWQSNEPQKVTVSSTGLVTAHEEGSTFVTASAEGKSASIDIIVYIPTQNTGVERVELNSSTQTLEEGEQFQLLATAYDGDGEIVLGRGVTWSSDALDYVHVAPDGMITAIRPGNANVKVRIDGREALCNVQVYANYDYSLLYNKASVGEAQQLYKLNINPVVHDEQNLFPVGRQGSHASPSPDGSQIAFVVYGTWTNNENWESRIYVADRDGSRHQQIVTLAARNEQPSWSPDGSKIVFRSWVFGEPSAIYSVAPDGSELQNLTEDDAEESHSSPSWSPIPIDGRYRIAYSRLRNGESYLWTMKENGEDKQQITSNPAYYDDEPDWSPDGNTIVFIRNGTAIFSDLYLVSAAGGNERALNPFYSLPLSQYSPKWSPDGKMIAYVSSGNFNQIWTIRADGTRPVQRSGGDYFFADPTWLPLL